MAFPAIAERDAAPDNIVEMTQPGETTAPAKKESGAAIQILIMLLSSLSKRTIIAISNLFTLITVGSAFWLWNSVRDPSPSQLISLGMYAAFVLAINFIIKRA